MLRALHTWGITARLIALAVLPACIMFLLVNAWLYESWQSQVARQIAERGELIAMALSETSQYGVVSGNLDYVERNIDHLVDHDPSVVAIEVLGPDRQVLTAGKSGKALADVSRFEAAIRSDIPEINTFDRGDVAHVAVAEKVPASFRLSKPTGYVRVTMSRTPLLAKGREQLFLGAAVALLAALLSVAGGLYLARGLSAPLRAVMVALREIRRGHYHVSLRPHARGELRELQTAIERMAAELARTQQHLADEVAQRTQQLEQALAALNRGNDEKRRLIANTNARLEEERQRISVEIHDQFNASLLVLGLQAQHIARIARQQSPADPEEIASDADKMNSTIQTLYRIARSMVKRLRPEALDTLGLRGALEEMCHSYDRLYPQCEFRFEMAEDIPNVEGDLAITVYRLVQEVLTNVVKHSRASRVAIRLRKSAAQLGVTITDNGVGFEPTERVGEGIGLIGMQERVASIGGTMAIQSAPTAGTTIEFALPLV